MEGTIAMHSELQNYKWQSRLVQTRGTLFCI